ncbi:glycosyl transferase, partial [Flavobacterium sp. HMWF030]
MKITITEDYELFHRKSDWDKTKEIIIQNYPEYEKSIEKYLDNNNKFYECNMMITSKKIWDEYHSWLFDVLFKLQKNITVPEDDYQKRIFGFISERLLNLYVLHHQYKIKEYPL